MGSNILLGSLLTCARQVAGSLATRQLRFHVLYVDNQEEMVGIERRNHSEQLYQESSLCVG